MYLQSIIRIRIVWRLECISIKLASHEIAVVHSCSNIVTNLDVSSVCMVSSKQLYAFATELFNTYIHKKVALHDN